MSRLVVLALLGFAVPLLGADPVPHKIIPTEKPDKVLKAGDKVGISVKVKNPKSVTDLVRFNWGGASVILELDEKSSTLNGEFVIPKLVSKRSPGSLLEVYGHGDVTFVHGATDAQRSQQLKDAAQSTPDEENRINYFNFFTPLDVESLPEDEEAPKISNVEIQKVDATHVRVTFDAEDESGLDGAGIMVLSRWNEDKARGIEAGKQYFYGKDIGCHSEKVKVTCSKEFELPETIFGEPVLDIAVFDGVSNDATYSSVDGKFKFEWKSRPVTVADLEVPELVDAELLDQKGLKVRLLLKNTGAPIDRALPGITEFRPDGTESSMSSYSDDAVLKDKTAESVEAEFSLPDMTPDLQKGYTYGIGLFLYSKSGASESFRLPDAVMKKIDLKAVPQRPFGPAGVPEVEFIKFTLK